MIQSYLTGLTDEELVQKTEDEISALCQGSKRWQMTVPVDFHRDSDVLFGELTRRFRDRLRVLEASVAQLKETV